MATVPSANPDKKVKTTILLDEICVAALKLASAMSNKSRDTLINEIVALIYEDEIKLIREKREEGMATL